MPTRLPHWRTGRARLLVVALRSRTTARELREGLFHRRRIRQDVEHPAPLEGRLDDPLVEPGRDVDAAVRDAVVVRRGRGEALGAPFGRHAGRGRVDGD